MKPGLTLVGGINLFELVGAVLVFIAAVAGGKVIALSLRRSLREKVAAHYLDMVAKVAYYLVVVGGLLWALSILGVGLSGLLVAGGVAGLVVGFASQQIVGNVISGLFLMVERPVKIGDQVNIEGTAGFVDDIRIISTTIRTYDGLMVRMPNEKVFTSNITNYVALACRRIDYTVGIRYRDDAEVAIGAIKEVLNEHPYVLVEPTPQVFVESFGESAVNLTVRFWSPVSTWYATRSELLWRIKQALEAKGIEIPFPQRTVWFGSDQEESSRSQKQVSRLRKGRGERA
ncbi:MAG: mechanosensitive ion channel family protein [candidate division KSB1 bacterium]|nr:mechanosensitive ion channel family protein [candidate division KSB1 bacterium]MDZ7295435.1 mechanosensitive ion channel family protein [candidate division KSB1 bacterium]MDZ7412769.1 mechanosensitive ion channel family protein [candidate division KSB1 bacterium]